MSFLDIRSVSKHYSGHVALDHVSLSVEQGTIYGLLGPNGAGKTSLIRIINRITHADSGEVLLEGRHMTDDDVAHLGYLPEERGLYKKMKVGEQIVYLARLKGMARVDAEQQMQSWLERFNLAEWRDKKLEALSKGMQQKVQFIATVIHRPKLLIFDEPFSGFDPVNAEQLKTEILRLRNEGSTILFSTHNMESVEAICERISLINHAKVVLEGRVDDIRRQHKKNIIAVELDATDTLPVNDSLYSRIPTPTGVHGHCIRLARGIEVRQAVQWLNDNCRLTGFQEILPGMQEIFIETVSHTSNPQPTTADTSAS